MEEIIIMSYNVGHSSSLSGLRAMLELEWIDIVLLQEVGINENQILTILAGLDYKAKSKN